MNATYTLLELKRITRNWATMFFTAVLPAFFFIIFGSTVDARDARVGSGNVTMYVMISMAAYGAALATTSIGGQAALERMQGWGRQLGITPMRDSGYVLDKAVIALGVAAIPIVLTYLFGAFLGAEGSVRAWILSGILCLLGAAVFALYGILMGSAFGGEASVGVASGSIVIFAFLGNVFIPLSGVMLTISKFSPLYGYVALARYPLTEGHLTDGSQDPLWLPILNVVVWALIFGMLATWFVRRGRDRQ